jgi:hypothetical protein
MSNSEAFELTPGGWAVREAVQDNEQSQPI